MANDLFKTYGKAVFLMESTYKTDAVDAAVQANTAMTFQELTSIDVTPVIAPVNKSRVRDHFSGVPGCPPLKDHLAVAVTGPMLGATNPGNVGGESPAADPIFRACGLVKTVSSGVNAQYRPDMRVNQFSASMHYWRRQTDDVTYRMTYGVGMRGNLSLNFDGIEGEATFTANMLTANFPDSADTAAFKGGWSAALGFWDQASLELDKTGVDPSNTSTFTDAAGACITNHSGVMLVDSTSIETTGLTLNLNLDIQPKKTTGSTSLTTKVVSTRGQGNPTTGTITVAETGAGFDKMMSLLMSANQVELTYVLSTAAGDVITVVIPKLQVRSVSESELAGMAAWSFGFQCNADTVDGDDDFRIVYAT